MPGSNVVAFVGRADDLATVDKLLTQNQQVNIAAAVVLRDSEGSRVTTERLSGLAKAS